MSASESRLTSVPDLLDLFLFGGGLEFSAMIVGDEMEVSNVDAAFIRGSPFVRSPRYLIPVVEAEFLTTEGPSERSERGQSRAKRGIAMEFNTFRLRADRRFSAGFSRRIEARLQSFSPAIGVSAPLCEGM